MLGFAVFETAIGWCGLAWGEGGIVGARLPEADAAATRASLARRYPGAVEAVPPPAIAAVVARVQALLAGEAVDLSDAPLDMSAVPAPFRRIYEAARRIPPGQTRTYGEIAREIGEPGAAQTVGQAMGKNPFPILMPCHRVMGAGGKLTGFSAPGGLATKLKLLEIEGARLAEPPSLFGELPLEVAPPRR
jgi:methylated-DNA-[protein]-cysteine S-methyltransferase